MITSTYHRATKNVYELENEIEALEAEASELENRLDCEFPDWEDVQEYARIISLIGDKKLEISNLENDMQHG